MSLYFNGRKVKINLNGIAYNLFLGVSSTQVPFSGTALTTTDNYILMDKNGLYLTVSEGN